MKITITNSQYFHQKYGGVSRYASCLLENLIGKQLNITLIAPIHKNKYLQNINNFKMKGFFFPKYPNLKILRNLNNMLTNFYKLKISADIVHDFYYPEIETNHKKKRILTIHDTIHEKFNYLYKFDYFNFRKKIIEKTDRFICVSESTRQDFMKYYNINKDRTSVIAHGYEHLKTVEIKNLSKFEILKKPFILYVGGRLKYKNFRFFIEAYSKNKKIRKNFNIVCFGGEKISKHELSHFKRLKIENKIIKLHGDDALLKSLYLNCRLLISTSEYEGFGINILEALYMNCKILSNEINVFKDIYEDSINYFQFNNTDHLIYQLERILLDEKNDINQTKIKQILKNNNWENSANKTYENYKFLANT